jgi:hypothetical protein
MRRFLMQLTAVAVGLSLTSLANAGGKGGGSASFGKSSFSQSSKYAGTSNFKTYSSKSGYSKFSTPYGKCFGKNDFYWSKSCFCSKYGCNCYWNDDCWYVWYQPTCQYVPYAYYITLVTPVVAATPVVATPVVASAPASLPAPAPGFKPGS